MNLSVVQEVETIIMLFKKYVKGNGYGDTSVADNFCVNKIISSVTLYGNK